MEIVFVRTRYYYESYFDFWKLVELSGFPTCYTDEVNTEEDKTYIVSPYNGEWVLDEAQKTSRKAKLYMLNLERPGGSGSIEGYIGDNQKLIHEGYFDDIFVADRKLSEITGFPYMMIGGHEDFCVLGNNHKIYDLITLSCYSYYRAWMFQAPDKLRTPLGGMKIAPNITASNVMRDVMLKATKAMLNVHQDGLPFNEPLRMILAVLYGMPIFTEDCDTVYPCYKFSIGMNGFNSFAPTMKSMLEKNYDKLYDEAAQARLLFTTENTFREGILRAVDGKG